MAGGGFPASNCGSLLLVGETFKGKPSVNPMFPQRPKPGPKSRIGQVFPTATKTSKGGPWSRDSLFARPSRASNFALLPPGTMPTRGNFTKIRCSGVAGWKELLLGTITGPEGGPCLRPRGMSAGGRPGPSDTKGRGPLARGNAKGKVKARIVRSEIGPGTAETGGA